MQPAAPGDAASTCVASDRTSGDEWGGGRGLGCSRGEAHEQPQVIKCCRCSDTLGLVHTDLEQPNRATTSGHRSRQARPSGGEWALLARVGQGRARGQQVTSGCLIRYAREPQASLPPGAGGTLPQRAEEDRWGGSTGEYLLAAAISLQPTPPPPKGDKAFAVPSCIPGLRRNVGGVRCK